MLQVKSSYYIHILKLRDAYAQDAYVINLLIPDLECGEGKVCGEEGVESDEFGMDAAPSCAQSHRVPVAVFVLEVLCAAQAVEPSVDHDGKARTQRLALLHATTNT